MRGCIGLAGCYLPEVHKALQQGRWQDARNPIAYVRTVAQREAIASGFEDAPGGRLHPESMPAMRDKSGQELSFTEMFDRLYICA